MAPILTIFGPNESQRCQLNFEKNLGRRKNFREGEKFEKLSRKVRKILSRTRFLGRNKMETFIFIGAYISDPTLWVAAFDELPTDMVAAAFATFREVASNHHTGDS